MKILLLSSKFPYPLKDGGAIATFQCYKGLREHAEKVHILSFNTSKHPVNEQDIPNDVFTESSFSLVPIDTTPTIIGALTNLLFSKKPYILERFKSIAFSKKLKQLLTQQKFDLIQMEGLYMLQYINDIREYSDAKIAFRAHNLEHKIWEQLAANASNLFKKFYLKVLARRIYRYELFCMDKYDALLPISGDDAALYKHLGSQKPIKVVPTGFSFSKGDSLQHSPGFNRLFFIGSLDWRPNQEGLIWFLENCWKLLKHNFPTLELHIAGRNAPAWLLTKTNLPGVVFHGEVESSVEFMKNKDVMIVPLLAGSGMRIKIVEAFVYSKAVVATSLAAKGTNSLHGTHIRIADEPQKFADEIITLLTHRNLYNKQVENANRLARLSFNNDTIVKELFKFYTTLVEEVE
jgi:polysaccharide biosynthesis protein PslH